MPRNLLLASSSRCHPFEYLDHCEAAMGDLFEEAKEIIFVPYARPGGVSWDEYTAPAAARVQKMGIRVRGIHEFDDRKSAIQNTGGVFIGGGNTFVLLKQLYDDGLVGPLREQLDGGLPYMGTSAGSNIAGISIGTSNDMPIAFPPSFDAMGVVNVNLNPHYPAAPPDPTHKGETREDRIQGFHTFNQQPVISLHEDGMLRVKGDDASLLGERSAYLFTPGAPRQTFQPGPVPIKL